LWRKNILARHCSQIARQENRVGRHYSRYRPIRRIACEQNQLLAQSKYVKIAGSAVESTKFG
jgi:hypothetical protein